MPEKKQKTNRREFIRNTVASTAGICILGHYVTHGSSFFLLRSGVPIVLIRDGASDYSVVTNPGSSASERRAAQELVKGIQKCTGVLLPVQEGTGEMKRPGHMLVLGYGEVSMSLGVNFDASELGEQGYLLKMIGNNVVIAGTSGAGTLYGVYRFMEDYLGIRWYAPGVTETPNIREVRISPVNRITTPGFLYREPYYAWSGKDKDFLIRLGINSGKRDKASEYGLGYGFYGTSHSYFSYVNPEEFFDAHPEYFSEIGGKRIRRETQLCLTNQEVFEIVADRMMAVMRERSTLRQYNFSQMDYYNGCQCDNCQAVNRNYGSNGATQFDFVNKLAERTSKEFPDKLIGTLAYTYTEEVPRGMKIHPNVAVWLCHMLPCCDSHPIEKCERNADYKRRAEDWSKVCSHLYIWHYIVDFAHYYNPFPNFRAMAADMRFYKRIGVEGIFAQGMGDEGGGGEFSLLRGYYCAKLLWNPDQDADEILKDFLKGYYGAAWESVWKYLSLLHDEVESKNIHLHLYVNPGYGHLSDAIVDEADQLFDQAERAVAGDSVLLDRVRVARMPLEYARLFPRNGYRVESGQLVFNGKIGESEEAGKFIGQMEKHGFKSIREGFSDPKQLLSLSAMFTSGLSVVTLDNETLTVDIVPALAGRVLRIIEKKSGRCVTAHNKVKSLWFPFTGGQENRIGELYSPLGWTEPVEIAGKTSDSVTMRVQLRNGLILEREIRLPGNEGRVHVSARLINPGNKPVNARLRSHLELELDSLDDVEILFTDKSGSRVRPKITEVLAGMREGVHYYSGQVPGGSWSFKSNGLEVLQSFDSGQVEFGWLHAYPEDLNDLEVELWLFNQEIEGGGRIVFEETIDVKSVAG